MIEDRHILLRLSFLLITVPIFAYGLLYSIEQITAAWKSKSAFKKWFALTLALLFLAIAVGVLG